MSEPKSFSNSITLVQVADGADGASANSYFIETNYDEILKFQTSQGLEFSPEILRFRVFDITNNSTTPISNFDWSFAFMNQRTGEFVELASSNNAQYNDYFKTELTEGEQSTSMVTEEVSTALYFYIDNFFKYLLTKTPTNDENLLLEYLQTGNPIFKFTYILNEHSVAIKIITCRYGVSAEMATLNIGATDITAAIRNSSLKFNESGLTLHNGELVITQPTYKKVEGVGPDTDFYNNFYYTLSNGSYIRAIEYDASIADDDGDGYYEIEQAELVFYADDQGNLTIKGNIYANDGYFHGIVEATEGNFSGKIEASEGTIGGFVIKKNKLQSSDNAIQLIAEDVKYTKFTGENFSSDIEYYEKTEGGYIKTTDVEPQKEKEYFTSELLGGHIHAGSIELGSATLTDKIVIKNATETSPLVALYNPEKNGGLVLQSGRTVLKDNGILNLGTIELNGGNEEQQGYIRAVYVDSNNEKQDGNWRINEDGSAYFNDIYANNAHIQESILEIGTVQSVGSLMLFKDSWAIVDISGKIITLDRRANLSADDWIYNGNKVYQVKESQYKTYYYLVEGEYEEVKEVIFNKKNTYYEYNGEDYIKTSDTNFYTIVTLTENYEDESLIVTKFGKNSKWRYRLTSKNALMPEVIYHTRIIASDFTPGNTYYEYDDLSKTYIKTEDSQPQENKTYYQFIPSNNPQSEEKELYCGESYGGDYILSIYGEAGTEATNFARPFAVGNSLTISDFRIDSNTERYTKHLILGDLGNSGIDTLTKMEGFGLYSDNVYLNGSLVTKSATNGYAGINTVSSVPFSKQRNPVIDSSNIILWGGANGVGLQDIQEARFQVTENGTMYSSQAIIENSVLVGGSLYSADIHTARIYGNNSEENQPGLIIYDANAGISFRKESEDEEVYRINTTGFSAGGKNFITLNNNLATFEGAFIARSSDEAYVALRSSGLHYEKANDIGRILYLSSTASDNKGYFDFTFAYSGMVNDSSFSIYRDKIVTKKNAEFKQDVWLGNAKMQYKNVGNGYDLYVYE